MSSPVRGIPKQTKQKPDYARSVLACTGHPSEVDNARVWAEECPRLYGASSRKKPASNLNLGVPSPVRGIPYPTRCKTKVHHHWEGPKNFGLSHKRGHDHLAVVSFKSHTTDGGCLIGGSSNLSNDPEQGGWRWVLRARCPYPHTTRVVRILHKPLMQLSVVAMRPATARWQDVAPTPWRPHAVQRSSLHAYACWCRYVPFCMPVGG